MIHPAVRTEVLALMTVLPITGGTRHPAFAAELAQAAAGGTAPPLTVLAGSAGCGLSTVLEDLREALAARGVPAHVIRCSPYSSAVPVHATLCALGSGAAPDPAPRRWLRAQLPWEVPATPEDTASAIADALGQAGVRVVLIDDAQWVDQHSLRALEQLVRDDGPSVRLVAGAQVPVADRIRAAVDRLHQEGRATVRVLRPMGTAELSSLSARLLRAECEPEFAGRLRSMTGGNHAAVAHAVPACRQAGVIRVAGGQAYLAERPESVVLPENHPLLVAVRRLGDEAWSAAKVAAALFPLGAALPELIASMSGRSVSEVDRTLTFLCHAGTLRRVAAGWRFRVPLVATSLLSHLAPYERRHLAQTAVHALWNTGAEDAEPEFYADQLAVAGKLVDPVRARAELLALVETSATPGVRERCLRAAAKLVADERDRAAILVKHAVACFRLGDHEQGLRSVERAMSALPPGTADGDLDELAHILALIRHSPVPAPLAHRAIGRATDLLVRGRCEDSVALLGQTEREWRTGPMSASLGYLVGAQAYLLLGRRERFERWACDAMASLPGAVGRQLDLTGLRLTPALLSGDTAGDLPPESLSAPVRAVLAMQRGGSRAGEKLARECLALGLEPGQELLHGALYRGVVLTLSARGRLGHARQLLAGARERTTLLPHLLDAAEAMIAGIVGDWAEVKTCLRRGLDYAGEHGIVLGVERLWAQLAEACFRTGDRAGARQALSTMDGLPDRGTSAGANLRFLMVRAIVDGDQGAAAEAWRLALDRNQPLELAGVAARLGGRGVVDERTLSRLYEALEPLDVPLYRASLRTVMRARGMAIRGRKQVLSENERLLVTLVAEGLSNQRLAVVLQTSLKGIESRLGRLFARTGCRSRVQLASAVRDGELAA